MDNELPKNPFLSGIDSSISPHSAVEFYSVNLITGSESWADGNFQKAIVVRETPDKQLNSNCCFLSSWKISGALYTIFTILLTLWNSEQKNGLLIKLFCFSSDFDETWWNCSTYTWVTITSPSFIKIKWKTKTFN